jgi:hypothetical protein
MANTSVMTDDRGNPSSSRWMTGIALIASIGFGIVACCKPSVESAIPVALANSFLAYGAVRGVGGKAVEVFAK